MTTDRIVSFLSSNASEVLAGLVGGLVVAGLTGLYRRLHGWYVAGRHKGSTFHIAGTFYTALDPNRPDHARYADAIAEGKTHVQELIWLGPERALAEFVPNAYVLNCVTTAMDRAKGAGILIGKIKPRAERPLLKSILGHHNTIPATDLVRLYKQTVGVTSDGRVHGIAPPTHESYAGSQHRRVLRAMFVSDSQLAGHIPPKAAVHFPTSAHANRYETLVEIIRDYHATPQRYNACRAYF
ncbi:MAG: hypothetical protein AAFY64_11260 [Pseudomonadota bacterium]